LKKLGELVLTSKRGPNRDSFLLITCFDKNILALVF
jgi:hypothetical protein